MITLRRLDEDRDRILNVPCSCSTTKGEPNVSTMEVANEMGIQLAASTTSGKEPLVLGLFERSERAGTAARPTASAQLKAGDCGYSCLIVERMAHYRFLFQDLSNLAGRLRSWPRAFVLAHGAQANTGFVACAVEAAGRLVSDTQALGQLVEQITLTCCFPWITSRFSTVRQKCRWWCTES